LFGHPFGKAPFLQIKIFFLGGCETFGKDAFAKEPPQPLWQSTFPSNKNFLFRRL
jgi:hypothetical protein